MCVTRRPRRFPALSVAGMRVPGVVRRVHVPPRRAVEPSMAELMPVADPVTSFPETDQIERVQSFTREPFVLEGEDLAEALAPGGARRRAFDAALAEIQAGADRPSLAWRRDYSLLL